MSRLISVLTLTALVSLLHADPLDATPKKWALLVAGSNGYYNYRHQADVCHAYQLLLKQGIAAENIVTMTYDDIAHNEENPFPGKIFNCPKRVDVYAGVKIDYKGDDVNAEVFLNVMIGNKTAVARKGSGRVIESGPNDHVFVYYTDHGATGIVGMPAGAPLTKADLWNGLNYMHSTMRYSKLVFYLEACESGSMLEGYPSNRNVYMMTAANPSESSWAVYCDEKNLPCLGDEFSVRWMHDSEQNNVNAETLGTQFAKTKLATKQSHVCKYGDFEFLTEAIGDFQGNRCDEADLPEFIEPTHVWPVQDVPLRELEKKIQYSKSEEEAELLRNEQHTVQEKRARVSNLFNSIARSSVEKTNRLAEITSVRPKTISQLKCHNEAVHFFDHHCLSFSNNPYVFHHAFILANLCEELESSHKILQAISKECAGITLKHVV